jgi:hypothetical protein
MKLSDICTRFVESILPKGSKPIDNFEGLFSYEFVPPNGYLSTLFDRVEAEKSNHGILDWGLSQSR